ncbi:dienelactone hydrolase family protein [Lentzea sp. BCCO 10_0856]|uniref:Dienelactone hydrolase family protein n=1 Tax=Lentzea miocenica TaxID=3095431 RepID=A0ABU4SS03_9PSEU|nr:dienelactone hydrolase family protein [Lentzea sp. BCCO 10_0856]MDX8028587.1 dienelactone hydrolase family protein [Lentzea sp. BCCO 10_0856]
MRIKAVLAALILALIPATATAAANPYERGPVPTAASVEASRGTFAVTSAAVARQSNFGGGTVYTPTSGLTFGAVAVSPGFTATQSSVAHFGPRLASYGFVVITINTLSGFDDPDSRGRQLLAALDYVVRTNPRVDASRLAVMGHSMGGGGALRAAATRPALQASIPMAGWHTTKSWPTVAVPTMVLGGQNDPTAPNSQHSTPFYNSMTAAPDKAFLELRGGDHSAPRSDNVTVRKYTLSWLKRFVDDDLRYDQFLCPAPVANTLISAYRDTCPHA